MHRLFDLHRRGKQPLITEELPLPSSARQWLLSDLAGGRRLSATPLPSQQQGQPVCLSERGQPPAHPVCAGGGGGRFRELFVWRGSQISPQQEPSGHSCLSSSTQPMTFFSSSPHEPELTWPALRSWNPWQLRENLSFPTECWQVCEGEFSGRTSSCAVYPSMICCLAELSQPSPSSKA